VYTSILKYANFVLIFENTLANLVNSFKDYVGKFRVCFW